MNTHKITLDNVSNLLSDVWEKRMRFDLLFLFTKGLHCNRDKLIKNVGYNKSSDQLPFGEK